MIKDKITILEPPSLRLEESYNTSSKDPKNIRQEARKNQRQTQQHQS